MAFVNWLSSSRVRKLASVLSADEVTTTWLWRHCSSFASNVEPGVGIYFQSNVLEYSGINEGVNKGVFKECLKKNPSGNIQKNCQYSKNLWVNNVQNLLALVCWAETRSPATPRYLNVIWTLFRNTPALFLRRRTDATFHWAPIQWSLRGSVQNRREASKRIGVQWRPLMALRVSPTRNLIGPDLSWIYCVITTQMILVMLLLPMNCDFRIGFDNWMW